MDEVAATFLADQPGPIPWDIPEGGRTRFAALNLFLGYGSNPLEVAVATAEAEPNVSDVRQLWKRRHGGRASPLLLAVLYADGSALRAAICGPIGDDPPVQRGLDPGMVERLAQASLAEPNRNAAIRFLQSVLPETELGLPGIRNSGMFATYELERNVPQRHDWAVMTDWGGRILGERGKHLIMALGFRVDPLDVATSVLYLKEEGTRTAVAVLLDEDESPDGASPRFNDTSPATYALKKADDERLPYVVVTRGSQIRVYAATKNTGVGRKGRAETFVEANLSVLPSDRAGYLPLLFGAPALAPEGTFQHMLESSKDYAADLTTRLRERVYRRVVPQLARVVALHRQDAGAAASEEELDSLYEQAMTILFRLLFVAYAEDKRTLPYAENGRYKLNALKTTARQLADQLNEDELSFEEQADDLWNQVQSLWRAVDQGHREWDVPSYNGGLFSSDPDVNPAGAMLAGMRLNNVEIGPALAALLVDQSADGVFGPVDFRSLSVREFGTIYEGLLESRLSVAPFDLTVDADENYVPAGEGDTVVARQGDIYLQHRSGARKSTGTYFTKPFAVEHLLDHALEPVLDDHLGRLQTLVEAGEEHAAAEAFFDFRCADIAMGSGHFLVAAVDHIEIRLSSFLAEHPIPGVVNELERLRKSAHERLGDLAAGVEIEQSSLLRRQVARRCIYGVDLNPIAVELARLAVWIHTFVPGLPLSFLDHNLVHGNSLTGIGTLAEAIDVLVPDTGRGGTPSMLRKLIEDWLGRAKDDLRRLGRLSDATAAEIIEARVAHAHAKDAVQTAANLFDLLVAIRAGHIARFEDISDHMVDNHSQLGQARKLSAELNALHFPVTFPEVFLRELSGFDCILGNPPWEKLHVEEHGYWALRYPGLRSEPVRVQNERVRKYSVDRPDLVAEYEREVRMADRARQILLEGPYPGLGRGHPDLYKAFAWRFWQLVCDSGMVGVVLPRSALSAAGGREWRERILDEGAFSDVTLLLNNRQWVFEDIHPQYTIGLVSLSKEKEQGLVRLRPYRSLQALSRGVDDKPLEFLADAFRSWTGTAAFPLLPDTRSGELFLKLRAHPRLDAVGEYGWRARPIQGDLNSTTDKVHMVFDRGSIESPWPVYKGASFYVWEPDTGEYYAWADAEHITDVLQEKRLRAYGHASSAFTEFDRSWAVDPLSLPCRHARIAFRRIGRATDSRTVIAALVPPGVVLTDVAPYFLWSAGTRWDEAYVLGVLCSVPLDWYARRIVETHLDFHVINPFPIPRPAPSDPFHQRVAQVSGRLAAVDERYVHWAEAVGVPVDSVDAGEKDDLIAELDAVVAHLYGLDESDVVHIFETFHEGWDYRSRLDSVLNHFRQWQGVA